MKHFKLTDTDLSLIFQSPAKLTIFVAVFLTVFLCTAVLIQIDIKNGMDITKVFTQRQTVIVLSDSYQNQINQILNDYLLTRDSQEFDNSDFCNNTISQTVTKILDLRVPIDYKEFHLKLVILLDKENQNCAGQDERVKNQLDEEWDELLGEYNWLRE